MTYDEQIKYLTENPDKIREHWENAEGIFKIVSKNGKFFGGAGHLAGCLTMIRGKSCLFHKAYVNGKPDEKLTEQIREDERIPENVDDITVENLYIFKEWHEKIDLLSKT